MGGAKQKGAQVVDKGSQPAGAGGAEGKGPKPKDQEQAAGKAQEAKGWTTKHPLLGVSDGWKYLEVPTSVARQFHRTKHAGVQSV